jgi:hypothetical protein
MVLVPEDQVGGGLPEDAWIPRGEKLDRALRKSAIPEEYEYMRDLWEIPEPPRRFALSASRGRRWCSPTNRSTGVAIAFDVDSAQAGLDKSTTSGVPE